MNQVGGVAGGIHSFSDEEKQAFSEHINNCLSNDPLIGNRLPLDPSSMALFDAVADGLLLCKLVNLAVPDTVDERALNKRQNMSLYLKIENQNLAINAAKSIGCVITNIGAKDLVDHKEHLVLGMLWQIIKIQLLGNISLTQHPELVRLLKPGEELSDFLKLSSEEILLRWFNFHLKEAGSSKVVSNFGPDVADGEAYSVLLHKLAPSTCDLANESDKNARAAHVIRNAKALGVSTFIQPRDIVKGNRKLNLGFTAQIFNICPGLDITEEELAEVDMSALEMDDEGDTREERIFRMWINSLNIPDLYINNLFADLNDGVALLKVMEHIEAGCVDWKRVNNPPKNRFKKVENGNYVVNIGRALNLTLVNVGGLDIIDGNKKMILAIVWQLMRKYTINILTELAASSSNASSSGRSSKKQVSDPEIVSWANQQLKSAGKSGQFSTFKDPRLADGKILIDLCASIDSRVSIDPNLVAGGHNEEERLSNAKYAINIARKLGACVFLTPEDIVEVKSKMIMTFCASLWVTYLHRK